MYASVGSDKEWAVWLPSPSDQRMKEGLISVTFRDMTNNKTNKHQWIVLDGDIDAEWIQVKPFLQCITEHIFLYKHWQAVWCGEFELSHRPFLLTQVCWKWSLWNPRSKSEMDNVHSMSRLALCHQANIGAWNCTYDFSFGRFNIILHSIC